MTGNAIIMQTSTQPDPNSIVQPITDAYTWGNTVVIWFAAASLAVALVAYVLSKSSD